MSEINWEQLNTPEINKLFNEFVADFPELMPTNFPLQNVALESYPLSIVHYQCLLVAYYQKDNFDDLVDQIFEVHTLGEILADWALATLDDDDLVKGRVRDAELALKLPVPLYKELLVEVGAGSLLSELGHGAVVDNWCQRQTKVRQQILADTTSQCPVCLSTSSTNETMIVLVPCGHGMCSECVNRMEKIARRSAKQLGRRGGRTVFNHLGDQLAGGRRLFKMNCPLCRKEPTAVMKIHL